MASYQRIVNIKGSKGVTDPKGQKGDTGATGPQGPKGDSPTSSEIQTAIKTVMKTLTWGSLA
jgi:hypothetical protein